MFQFSDYGLSVDVVLLGAIAAILILLILCLILIGKNSRWKKSGRSISEEIYQYGLYQWQNQRSR